jgi:hypothetical protein
MSLLPGRWSDLGGSGVSFLGDSFFLSLVMQMLSISPVLPRFQGDGKVTVGENVSEHKCKMETEMPSFFPAFS